MAVTADSCLAETLGCSSACAGQRQLGTSFGAVAVSMQMLAAALLSNCRYIERQAVKVKAVSNTLCNRHTAAPCSPNPVSHTVIASG